MAVSREEREMFYSALSRARLPGSVAPSTKSLPRRLELLTLRLTASRSSQLSYGSTWRLASKAKLFKTCVLSLYLSLCFFSFLLLHLLPPSRVRLCLLSSVLGLFRSASIGLGLLGSI